jgi:hypothetical protein
MCHIRFGDSKLGSVPSHKGQRSASVENRHVGLWGMYGRFGTTLSVRGVPPQGTFQPQITNIRDYDMVPDSADPSSCHLRLPGMAVSSPLYALQAPNTRLRHVMI